MTKLTPTFARSVFLLGIISALHAQPATPRSADADRAWLDLQAPLPSTDVVGREQEPNSAARKATLAAKAAGFVSAADRARDFYTQFPQHAKIADAKLAEVRALVNATQAGDATVEGRLASLVQTMRTDLALPETIRVQAACAYEFSRQMRGTKTREERLKGIETVARQLTVEFPGQPQGYESLLTVAATSDDDAQAKKIARELTHSNSPTEVKENARTLLERCALIGKPLVPELEGAHEIAAKASLLPGRPTILYSWTTGSRGSLAVAADLKQSGLAANLLGLNLDSDTRAAEVFAQKQGLVGTQIYDGRGKEGALAQRLKIKKASQVLLIDAQGLIREVNGERDLKRKLKQLGL